MDLQQIVHIRSACFRGLVMMWTIPPNSLCKFKGDKFTQFQWVPQSKAYFDNYVMGGKIPGSRRYFFVEKI